MATSDPAPALVSGGAWLEAATRPSCPGPDAAHVQYQKSAKEGGRTTLLSVIVGLWDSGIVGLRDCGILGLRDCWIARLRDCGSVGLRDGGSVDGGSVGA